MRWFDNVKKVFSQLNMNQKLEALFLMHNMSSPDVLSEVSQQLTAATSRDFVRLLPPKIVSKIFCYLDSRSLVCCAGVNQKWRLVVIDSANLWTRALKQLPCSSEDSAEPPYQLYMRFRKRVNDIRRMNAQLEFPSIAEFSHDPNLCSVKNIQSTASGKLVMSYSVKQPQDFFQKYDVSTDCSSSEILDVLNTNYVVDFVTTDLFLYSSSISGDWQCNMWADGKEVFKINTKENSINNRWFSSFASPCDKCPLLTIFDSNKIRTPINKESFCPIKMITSDGIQFGVRQGNFVCSAKPNCNALVNNVVVSCAEATDSSCLVPCDHHKVILQQQDFQIFIYKVNTQPTLLAQRDLNPELLHQLDPAICPDVPQYIFDCYKFCLSLDQKLIGFTCGSEFVYWNLDSKTCRRLTISGGFNNLMLLGIGDVFTLVAEVKTLISIQPIIILTGTGKVVKVFPALEPSETNANGQSKLYNFLTTPLHLSWLNSSLEDDDINDVITVFAAAYNGGTVFSIWSLVL